MKISSKLVTGYSLLILLIIALSLFSVRVSQIYFKNEAGKSSVFLAEEMMRRLDYGIYLRVENLRRFSRDPALNTPTSCSQYIQDYFITYFETTRGYSFFKEAAVLDSSGYIICATNDYTGTLPEQETWWQTVRRGEFFIGEITGSETGETSKIEIAVPILDQNRIRFLGSIRAVISLVSLLRETELLIKRYDTTEIELINESGLLLYKSNAFQFLESVKDKPYFDKLTSKSGYFFQKENRIDEIISYTKSTGYGAYKGLNWILILKHDLSDILSETIALGRLMTAFSVVLFIIAIGIALFISRSIRKPLNQLHLVAEQVADGDLTSRIQIDSNDEISEFSKTFNNMIAKLQSSYNELEKEIAIREETERVLAQRNEELFRSNQELDDFSYIVSHDLREPLRGIRNYGELLLEDYGERLDEQGRNYINVLMRLSSRLDNLIQSLLYYSRAGRYELSFKTTDIESVLQETIESLSLSIKEQNVDINIIRPLPKIRCDGTRVGEIFYNLLSNAIKYNDNEKKYVEIGIAKDKGPEVFYVKDNGIGIREKHLETVFKMFKRLHPRDRYGGGTGSGLTIVRKLVERHGGSIWVESISGEGSTFYFTLSGRGEDHGSTATDTDR